VQTKRRTSIATPEIIDFNDSHIVLVPEATSRCRVLIVDDDDLVLERLTALVHQGGYEVHTARSGAAALRILAETRCQIVLTDWSMPDMDGLALCRRLRQRENEGYIYILLLTIRSSRSDIVAGLAAGADDYVIKGATSEELLARIAVGRRITNLERSLRTSNRENRRLSVTDALTGVRNRRFLMKYLPREQERARRGEKGLAVLSCDIDHFKRVNDDFGHEAGDAVLQEFTKRAGSCIRQTTDWIARSGGEEFVVILPETDLILASGIAERLRQVVAADAIPTCSGPVIITVSIGVSALATEHVPSEASVADLLRAADRGLYESKRSGRNRVTAIAVGSPNPDVTAWTGARRGAR
jgi:two-component system, cell cycle response regulator